MLITCLQTEEKNWGFNTKASKSKNAQPYRQIRTACSSPSMRPSEEASWCNHLTINSTPKNWRAKYYFHCALATQIDTPVKIPSIKKRSIYLNPGKIHTVHFILLKWTGCKRGWTSPESSESHPFNGQLQGTQIIAGKAAEELMQKLI